MSDVHHNLSVSLEIRSEPYKEGDELGQDGDTCLRIIRNNWDVENPNRYHVFRNILKECAKYTDPLHKLACAYACHYSKVEYRLLAIKYFEEYLKDIITSSQFPLRAIYRDLAEDYEKEYDFINAEKYYLFAIRHDDIKYSFPTVSPFEMHLGKLYLKISTQKALAYWSEYKTRKAYEQFPDVKRLVDIQYNIVLKKHQRGYIYKPRPRKQAKYRSVKEALNQECEKSQAIGQLEENNISSIKQETNGPNPLSNKYLTKQINNESSPKKIRRFIADHKKGVELFFAIFCLIGFAAMLSSYIAERKANILVGCIFYGICSATLFVFFTRDKKRK